MNKPKDNEANLKYGMYKQGYSLEDVAKYYGCSRQSVYELFKNRNLELRHPIRKEFIEFNGNKYTRRKDGYYRKTNGDRTLLHKDVWIFYNGEVPKGYDVHHKDKDITNNDINNLEMICKSEHGKRHSVEGHNIRWGGRVNG